MLFVFIYIKRCLVRFQYQMTFVWFNNNMTGATSRTGTATPSGAPGFIPDCFVDRCLSFWTVFFGYCIASPSSIYGF
jgi:hypothetical protein